MAICFRGTFDDSGDQDDPQHNCASLGGYIGSIDAWDRFEIEWKRVLDEFSVPYLHMKEFKNPNGHYVHLLNDRDRMAMFFAALAQEVGSCGLFSFGSVVRIKDLKRFNQKFGLNINSYSLALADCLGNISLRFPDTPMDLRVDRGPKKVYAKIETSLEYLASWISHPQCFENVETHIAIAPLPKGMTFRNVQAIQAADFAAWEMRKSVTDKDDFFTNVEPSQSREQRFLDYLIWEARRKGSVTIPPDNERRSFSALKRITPIVGSVYDFHGLCCEHEARGGVWSTAQR